MGIDLNLMITPGPYTKAQVFALYALRHEYIRRLHSSAPGDYRGLIVGIDRNPDVQAAMSQHGLAYCPTCGGGGCEHCHSLGIVESTHE